MSVVALAAIAAVSIMVTQSSWARQRELEAEHEQALALTQAGIDWARAILTDSRRASNIDYLGQPWALRLPAMPIENGKLDGYIEDQQGKFNLNNLVKDGKANPGQVAHFRRLLSQLELPDSLADKLIDWIDADNEVQPAGAEDGYYLAMQPPYLAANRPLIDVAELALVAGFDNGVRARLSSFITALPALTAVNVNTAPPEVLASIIEGLDIDGARALAAARERAYFRDRTDFLSRLPKGTSGSIEDVAVSSDYFKVWTHVTIDEAETTGTALLARQGTGWPVILWHKTL